MTEAPHSEEPGLFEPRQLRAFAALARHMHFGRAAESIGVSQPTLSLRIRALEEAVGAPLIHRSNRTLALTALGESFLADATRILAMMERARRNAEELLSGEEGEIALGVCPGVISSGALVAILSEARRRHPRLRVRALVAPPFTLLGLLECGAIDLMASVTFGLALPKGVLRRELARWDAVLAAPAERWEAAGRPESLEDAAWVKDETFICYEGAEASYPRVVESLLGFSPVRTMSTASSRLMMAYVDAGCGVVVIPSPDAAAAGPATRIVRLPGGRSRMPVEVMRLATSNAPMTRRMFELIGEAASSGGASRPPAAESS